MYNAKPAAVGVLAISLLIGFGSLVSYGRDRQDGDAVRGGSDIGMVDLERVYDASDAPQQFAQKAAEIETDAASRIDAVAGASQLEEAEIKEFGDLLAIREPSAPQKNRIDELKAINNKRAGQLRDLQTKPDAQLTAEDKKLLSAAAKHQREFDQMIRFMQDDMRAQVAERERLVKRDLVTKIRGEVARVAKEKKVQHVFDVGAMVCSSNDLTAAAIQKVKHSDK